MKQRPFLGAVVAVTLWFVSGASVAWGAEDDPFFLVRNKRNPLESVTPTEVRNIFTGKTSTFATGSVQLVLEKSNPEGPRWLAEKILDIPMATLFAKIRQEVFRERMNKPLLVDSDAQVVNTVANNPAALGIVPREVVSTLPKDVAVVPILPEGGRDL